MDRKRYKVTFEIETDEFIDESDFEISMEHMFPNWRKINVEIINSIPSQEIIKVNPSSDTVSDKVMKKALESSSANDTKTPDNIHTEIKGFMDKNYEK